MKDEYTCEPVAGGAEVRFPFDRERLAAFRDLFPDARWRKDRGAWFIPEPEAADRANLWIDERRQQERAADEAAARAAENNAIEHPRVSRLPQGWAVRTPYDPALAELLRGLPGARWNTDLKRWTVPLRAAEALRAALPQLTESALKAERRANLRTRQAYRARSPLTR
jgi:hypothetical protein